LDELQPDAISESAQLYAALLDDWKKV